MPSSPLMKAVFHLSRARLGGWHAHISLLLALATTLYIVVPTLAGEGQTTGFCKGTVQRGGKILLRRLQQWHGGAVGAPSRGVDGRGR
jgi:hypothetical protein